MSDFNRWFRRVRISHRMTKTDVVEVCRLGGLTISGSKAEAWARGVQRGQLERGERRSAAMTASEWEAFTSGLVDWSRAAYDEGGQ